MMYPWNDSRNYSTKKLDSIRKINTHFIVGVIGKMCLFEVPITILCLLISVYYGESALPFGVGTLAFLTIGVICQLLGKNRTDIRIGRREGMLSVTITWLVLSLLGAIPFLLKTGIAGNFFSALFETISGYTTTGATAYADIESLGKGLMLWRALLQWQGGIGIVVFTVALIPIFSGGASHIFNAETTGITHDRFLPKISDVAKRLTQVYILETALFALLLWLGPMGLFDSICHACTSISTGGYSNYTSGVSYFNSSYTEYVLTIAMYTGSLNMTLIYFAILGKPIKLIMDEEFRWFTGFIVLTTLVTAIWLWHIGAYSTIEETFRKSVFQCVSLGSSTGLLTADITAWQPFFWFIALLLMFINGCTGSTAGGLKMARFIVLVKNLANEFKKQIRPHMLTPVLINGKQLSISIVHQILAFCVLYVFLIISGAILITLDGNSFDSSVSIAVSCVSNSGPGIGKYVSNVAEAGDFTKAVLSFLMLAGRLEVFTVISILTPYFWRR